MHGVSKLDCVTECALGWLLRKGERQRPIQERRITNSGKKHIQLEANNISFLGLDKGRLECKLTVGSDINTQNVGSWLGVVASLLDSTRLEGVECITGVRRVDSEDHSSITVAKKRG